MIAGPGRAGRTIARRSPKAVGRNVRGPHYTNVSQEDTICTIEIAKGNTKEISQLRGCGDDEPMMVSGDDRSLSFRAPTM